MADMDVMETIVIITDNTKVLDVQVGRQLYRWYQEAEIVFRTFTADLLDELSSKKLPVLILIDSFIDCLIAIREIKTHPILCRIPVLMLHADATIRKAKLEQKELTSLVRSVHSQETLHFN
jgi:hypothetical protein